jgi:hypothetical protein
MNIIERYRRLNIWNKLGVWGSLASVLGFAAFLLWPIGSKPTTSSTAFIDRSPGATIMQSGRDLIVNQSPKAFNNSRERSLLPQQERLLALLASYQRQFGANKLIISRADGSLHFDGDPERGSDISLVRDLFGSIDTHNGGRFEQLVENMPSEYVRLLGETRLDNPLVISVTEAGNSYLRKKAR